MFVLLIGLSSGPTYACPDGQVSKLPVPRGLTQVATRITFTLSLLFGGYPSGVVVVPEMG